MNFVLEEQHLDLLNTQFSSFKLTFVCNSHNTWYNKNGCRIIHVATVKLICNLPSSEP